MPGLAKKLKGVKIPTKKTGPVWKGPDVDGITQSLLSRFLVCRERFRLLVVEGLKPVDTFNQRIEYGRMWHTCEEALAKGINHEAPLLAYCKELVQRYRSQQNEIDKWYNVCKTQFPIYVKYWKKHKHTTTRKPLSQEQEFRVPYQLPSGRILTLRGKWDSVDLVKKNHIYLQENKTKSELNEQQIKDQLQFDLQTMLYLVALKKCFEYADKGTYLDTKDMLPDAAHWIKLVYPSNYVLAGVRYNGVRRPLSGGKGSIRQHKATSKKPEETKEAFYKRLEGLIMEDTFGPKDKPLDNNSYFARWDCQVSAADIARFEQRFLIPVGEQLCNWWEYMQRIKFNPWNISQFHIDPETLSRHWQTPFGFYNVLAEGGRTDLDEHISNGSEVGLQRTNNLFPELE